MDAQPPFIPSLEEFQEIRGGGTPRRAATERWRTALVDGYDALYSPRQRHDSSTDDDETVDLKEEKRHLQELLKIVDTKIGVKVRQKKEKRLHEEYKKNSILQKNQIPYSRIMSCNYSHRGFLRQKPINERVDTKGITCNRNNNRCGRACNYVQAIGISRDNFQVRRASRIMFINYADGYQGVSK
ncbi:hypothetical protein DMENIID0001_098970 [Sergentomyia squamirostris]